MVIKYIEIIIIFFINHYYYLIIHYLLNPFIINLTFFSCIHYFNFPTFNYFKKLIITLNV